MAPAKKTLYTDKENKWRQSIAVDSKMFIDKVKIAHGYEERGRKIICADDTFELREVITPFGNADNLDSENTYLWDQPIDRLRIYRPPASLIGQFLYEN
jgi:hypothetical protein